MLLVSAFPEQKCKSWLGPGAEIFIRSSFVFLCLQMPKISPHVHARDTFVPRYSLNKKHGGRSGEETNQLRKDYVKLNEETGTPGDFAENVSAVCSLCCLIKVRKKHSVLAKIDLVTVFDAILTSRQTRKKLQCLYENLMSNNFRITAFLKKKYKL